MSKESKAQGKLAGMPYDFRKPTSDRVRSRWWNPEAGLFTPKAFGWGYGLNFYVIVHPIQSRRARSAK